MHPLPEIVLNPVRFGHFLGVTVAVSFFVESNGNEFKAEEIGLVDGPSFHQRSRAIAFAHHSWCPDYQNEDEPIKGNFSTVALGHFKD